MSPSASSLFALIALITLACTASRPDLGGRADTVEAGAAPTRVATAQGFENPEAARYDADLDLFFIASMNGDPTARDGNGYISRLHPDGTTDSLRLVTGGANRVTLNAPKGMAIAGDTLWVADIDAVRGFNKRTGAPVATVSLAGQARFLNDLAVGPGGIYATDTGLEADGKGGFSHPGPDRVFRIAPDRKVTVAFDLPAQTGPNGITWDSAASRFLVVCFQSPTIYAWAPGQAKADSVATGPGMHDGIEPLGSGRFLVSAWADSSLSVLEGGQMTKLAGDLPSIADIALDRKRGRVAAPLLMERRVELIDLPKGSVQ